MLTYALHIKYILSVIVFFLLISCQDENYPSLDNTSLDDNDLAEINSAIDTAINGYINRLDSTSILGNLAYYEAYSYLQHIGDKFSSNDSSLQNSITTFKIIDGNILNKTPLILDGGYIYMNKNFISSFESESAFVGAIGLSIRLSKINQSTEKLKVEWGQAYIEDILIGNKINNVAELYHLLSYTNYAASVTERELNQVLRNLCSINFSPSEFYTYLTNPRMGFRNKFHYNIEKISTSNVECLSSQQTSNDRFNRVKSLLK